MKIVNANNWQLSVPVTVCIITYNHERYIEQALDSVLAQITDFKFQIVIADDNSSDGTSSILLRYAEEFSDRISLLLQDHNQGPARNFNDLMAYPNSPYISYLEGDDYWTDERKLQLQYDCVVNNPTIALVYTDAYRLLNGALVEFYQESKPSEFPMDLFQFLDSGLTTVPSCTSFIRRDVIQDFIKAWPSLEKNLFHGDFLLWCIAGKHGKLSFLNTKTAVYRVHQSGIVRSTPMSVTLERGLLLNRFLSEYLGPEFKSHFNRGEWWYYLELSYLEIQKRNTMKSMGLALRSVWSSVLNGHHNQIQILRDYFYRFRNRNGLTL